MRRSPFFLTCFLAACSAPDADLVTSAETADPSDRCLFGESSDQWYGELPGIDASEGWSVVDEETSLWPGALEQILVTLDYGDTITSYEDALNETDEEEFRFKEISDRMTGKAYLAWSYIGGDNLHGAIFELDSSEPLARLSDQEVYACQLFVPAETPPPSCKDDDGASPESAPLVGTTGVNLVADGSFRSLSSTFESDTDVDWFRADFESSSVCTSCFHPHVYLETESSPIGEVCVFVDAKEAWEKGNPTCHAGWEVSLPGLMGCCASDLQDGVWMDTEWDHAPGEGSSMWLRVTPAADAPAECTTYELTWGHFIG